MKPINLKDMKTLLKFFVALILISGLITFLLLKCSETDNVITDNVISHKIENFRDKNGMTRARVETNNGGTSDFTNNEMDSLKRALDIKNGILSGKNGEILAITELKGKLQDSLKLLRVNLDAEKHKVWEWEKKYKSGSVFRAKMSERDSVLIPEADIVVLTDDRTDGRGRKKKYYTDFFSPDQNIKFNGARTYRVERKEIKDVFQLDFNTIYSKGFFNNQNDGISTELEININPDGRFSIGGGVGTTYQFQQYKFYPYFQINTKYNVFKVPSR